MQKISVNNQRTFILPNGSASLSKGDLILKPGKEFVKAEVLPALHIVN